MMFFSLTTILFAFLFKQNLSLNSLCSQIQSESGTNVVFIDEFNEDQLNTEHWTVTIGPHGSQLREALGLESNVYIEDGALVLRSLRNTTEYDDKIYEFTSGSVTSRNKATWTHGIACVIAKLPGHGDHSDDGIWPAHWMMPEEENCWPDHGEIDIMEMVNGDGSSHGIIY